MTDYKVHIERTTEELTACGIYFQAETPRLQTTARWEEVTCNSCLHTTIGFGNLALSLDFPNLRAMPERLRMEGLRIKWKISYDAGDGNEMTRIFAFLEEEYRSSGKDIHTPDHEDDVLPSIFDYATKELSQDAMICWLIRLSGECTRSDEGRQLTRLGRNFVRAMLAKHDTMLSGSIVGPVEIYQQYHGIDVLVRVRERGGGEHVLLIEDKTYSEDHGDQLQRYRDVVLSGESVLGAVAELWPIYLKTGNHSLQNARVIESKVEGEPGYKVFNRRDFLNVLTGSSVNHPIATQFRTYLQALEDEFNSWTMWSQKNREYWSKASWEGFYWAIENRMINSTKRGAPGLIGWGFVPNRQGGFLGLWWFPFGWSANYTLYLQLEVVPDDPSRQRLCFKAEAGDADLKAADYHALVRDAAHTEGVEIDRPPMRTRATMTVGRWHGEWLVFGADDRPDLARTVGTLWRAQRILKWAQLLPIST